MNIKDIRLSKKAQTILLAAGCTAGAVLIGVSALLLALPKKPLPVEGGRFLRAVLCLRGQQRGKRTGGGDGDHRRRRGHAGQLRRRDEKDDLRPDPGHSRPAGSVGGEQTHR